MRWNRWTPSRRRSIGRRWACLVTSSWTDPTASLQRKTVMSSTREPKKLDWLRLLRLSSSCRMTMSSGACLSKTCPRSTSCTPIDVGCSTQHVIAVSSGEAQLYATGRCTSVGDRHAQPHWIGRVRHLDVRWLWAQEAVLKKVGTTEYVSDEQRSTTMKRGLKPANGWAAVYQRTTVRSLGGHTSGR